MLKQRTDLAMEAKTLWEQSTTPKNQLDGVESEERVQEGFSVHCVRILNEQGARALGKPVGTYITILLDPLFHREAGAFPRAARAVAAELSALLTLEEGQSALVVGLGNRAITPDAVGPKAVDHTMVTRHLVTKMPDEFGDFRAVSSLAAGVLGTTGVESSEMVCALTKTIAPSCVLAIDALASRSLSRVCRTIQLSNTGIVPGSGVGNHRSALNQETLGVPVIAIGVPTVVDGATLCADILEEAGQPSLEPTALGGAGSDLFVTPRDIDASVSDMAKVIGFGINLALHSDLTVEDVELFLS